MSSSTPPQDPESGSASARGDEEAARLLEAGLSTGAAGKPRGEAPSPESMAASFPALEILEVLGQGGMGVVYKARQRKLDRLVALKVLPRALSADPAFAERFTREARTLARLTHPHIVGVFEFGEADGLHYLLMEYVDGVTLRQLMAGGELSPREALAIVPQMCEALQYAHDQGVVHRDIKPENILLDRAGRVKVADFGLAKLMQRSPGDFTLTGTDQVMGTLHYMAPEQYKTPQDVDHRADIFSLGVVFYEMLTNELPVGRFAKPSEAGALDTRIDEIVMRTLERSRELRYQQASELETDVETFVGGAHAEAESAEVSAEGHRRHFHHERHAWRRERPVDERPLSRWTSWALLLIPILAAGAFIAWAMVLNFHEPQAAAAHEAAEVGYSTAAMAGLLVALVAITAVLRTSLAKHRVRGLGLSIAALVIGMISSTAFFSALAQEIKSHRRQVQWDRELMRRRALPGTSDYGMPPSIDPHPISLELPAYKRQTAIREAIAKTWSTYVDRVDMEELGRHDLESLYSGVERNRLGELSDAEFETERKAGRLGMGLITEADAGAPLYQFRLSNFSIDQWERRASVTAMHVLRKDGRQRITKITFPMKRTEEGWVFTIGLVGFEKR